MKKKLDKHWRNSAKPYVCSRILKKGYVLNAITTEQNTKLLVRFAETDILKETKPILLENSPVLRCVKYNPQIAGMATD